MLQLRKQKIFVKNGVPKFKNLPAGLGGSRDILPDQRVMVFVGPASILAVSNRASSFPAPSPGPAPMDDKDTPKSLPSCPRSIEEIWAAGFEIHRQVAHASQSFAVRLRNPI
jgi:hypothetical protein